MSYSDPDSDTPYNTTVNPKLSSSLLDQKIADLAAASKANTAKLTQDYEIALRNEALRGPVVQQADALRTAGDVGIKLAQGVVDLGQSVVGIGSLATGGAVGKAMRAIGYDPEETNKILGDYLSDSQKAADDKVQKAEGFVDTLKASVQNPRSILGSVAESTPGMLAIMGGAGAVAGRIASKAALEAGGGELGAKAAQEAVDAAGSKLTALSGGLEGAQSAGQIADQAQGAGREYSDYALPALAAGAITGAVSIGANKVFGDAATDIATGSHTLKGSKLARLGKEALSEGVVEEMPQSAQEQYFTNIAMGEQDTMKGVANAAATGLVSGAAMGVGFGSLHSDHSAKPQQQAERVDTPEVKQKVAEAVQNNDVSAFTDSKSPDYDLSKATQVLLQNAQQDTATPETKQANLEHASKLIAILEDQHAQAQEDVKLFSPEGIKGFQDKLSAVTEQMKTVDPTDLKTLSNLKDRADTYKEIIQDYSDPNGATRAATIASKVDRQLTAARSHVEALTAMNTPVASPTVVSGLMKEASTDNVPAQKLINLSMTQPDVISSNDALALANDKSNALTDAQREHFRTFSDARLAENKVSDTNSVSQQVLYGDPKSGGNVGVAQYRTRITSAIAGNNEDTANRQAQLLNNFAQDHEQKAALAQQALQQVKADGSERQLIKGADGWSIQPAGTMTAKELQANGGLQIHRNSNKGGLISDLIKESRAVTAASKEMNSAISLKFGVQSSPSTESANPLGNINTPTNEEDTARPELRSEPSNTVSLPSTNNKLAATLEKHAEYLANPRDNHTTANTQAILDWTTKQVDRINKAMLTTDENSDRGLELSDMRSNAKRLIKEAKRQIEADNHSEAITTEKAQPAKVAADEQQEAVSEANSSQAVETATPEAVVENNKSNNSEEATSPSSQPASLAVADAPAATVTSSAPVADQPASTLSVFNEVHDKSAPYTEQNLIGTKFKQDIGTDKGTERPLAKVNNFIQALKDKTTKISDFVQQKGDFTPEQRKAVSTFVGLASAWNKTITDNLKVGNAGYAYEDMIQFLMKDGDLDQNTKTAIAYGAYSWVAENAARPVINEQADINAILGRDEDHPVSQAEYDALTGIGTRQNVVANSMGQRIVDSLGLKALADAPKNLQADLNASIGAHAMKLLLDQGIMTRTTFTGQQMADLTKNKDTNTNAVFHFVGLARSADFKLLETAENIYQTNKGTKNILDKLFGVEPALKEPSLEPIKTTQKTTRNTNQGIPSELHDMVQKDDSTPSFVNAEMYNLLGQIDPETLLTIAGKEEGGEAVHKTRRGSVDAKNAGLERELDRFMGFIGSVGADVPLHFEHSVWMQQRVGIATNLINPQTSKIHRAMLYRSDWKSEINFADQDAMTNFKLRVAEGLGIKTDKKSKEKALDDLSALLAKPEIKGAVKVLVKSLNGPEDGKLSANDQDVLIAGAKAGGENMHTLATLMALAKMTDARNNGETSFTTTMMAEVDGVTNGPMLSNLALGGANSTTDMYDLINRGGFYQEGSNFTEYNNWRNAPGNFDLYERTAGNMVKDINASDIPVNIKSAIFAFTGELADSKGVVQKAGRNIIKTPVTEVHFGSSVPNTVNSMADNFVASIYQAIEDSNNNKDKSLSKEDILKNLAQLGVQLPANTNLMEHEFTSNQVENLKDAFKDSVGKAVKSTMEDNFFAFIANRTEFNKTAQLTFTVYNSIYTAMREAKIAELVKSGDIATNPKTGKPLHDLTNKQEAELQKQIKAIIPVANTPLSLASGEPDTGVLVAKSERKLSTDPLYQSIVKFGTPFTDGAKSTQINGYTIAPANPGVAMVPVMMHSTDSAISVRANPKGKALNVHDAQGHGVNGILATAQAMNKATWDTLLQYSPAAEMTKTYMNVIHGLDAMIKSGTLPDTALTNLVSELNKMAAKEEKRTGEKVNVQGMLAVQGALVQAMATRADALKLDTMATMQAVNQYAMEGGSYIVTDADRDQAATLRDSLASSLTAEDQAALDRVSTALEAITGAKPIDIKVDSEMDTSVPTNTNTVAELGKPIVKSDNDLVKAFAAKPSMTLQEVADLMKGKLSDGFQKTLLKALVRSSKDDLTINYVTKDNVPSDILAQGGVKSAGWYVSNGQTQAIYLLSPDFKYSALTPELVLHELVHASLAQTIEAAKVNPSSAANALVNELDDLRKQAEQYITANNKAAMFSPAVENIQELVSWGMTNKAFQDQVLKNIQVQDKTANNKLKNGLQTFIDKLVSLVFGRPNVNMNNGMTQLIANVAGLMNQAAQTKDASVNTNLVLNQTNNAQDIRDLSTIDIYEALSQSNNGSVVTPEHNTHLTNLLNTVVNSVYGPFGSFKAAMMEQTAQTPEEVYAEALRTGVAPFASESLSAGFAFTDQEAFVLEQVEASMSKALQVNDGVISIAYKELSKLYSEARAKLTVESFYKGDWATANQVDKDQAKALYNFVFAIKQDATGKSDYMSRFAALGLVHSGFRELLQFNTKTTSNNTNLSFNERLNKVFNTIMSWVAGKMTNTFSGQRADAKLTALVQQLIQIEAKKKGNMLDQTSVLNRIGDTAGDMSDKVRAKVEEFGKKPFFKESSDGFVRAVGGITSAVAGDRVDAIMEGFQRFRDKTMTGQLGVAASLVNEIRGATAVNQTYHFLLRATKHLEGMRKDVSSSISQAVMGSFANNGEDITDTQKSAMTNIVLRGDMQSLMGQYNTAQLSNLVSDSTALQAEIDTHEAQLTGQMSRFYTNSAKGLGYFMATNKVATAHQLMNASNIALLYGTGMESRVTEADANKATPIIDRLASLYAIQYASNEDKVALNEVFNTEAARTDRGNGLEMIMKQHQRLSQEAQATVFQGSEALMMKGYLPEIYDPYMSVVIANKEQGEDLVRRGYTAMSEGQMKQDVADTTSDPKQIYSRRDGGLKQWNSGIFSTTDTRAKGSQVLFNSQQNSQAMASIQSGKHAGVQAMFTGLDFDPTKVEDTHMAPVINPTGEVVNYRYMMSKTVKDNLLNRDNRTERLLGAMAAGTFDKQTAPVQNRKAVQALYDQYREDFAQNPNTYLQVSAKSSDPQLREIWRMLPAQTKADVNAIWGRDAMYVRNDVLDMNFGYRKLSIGSVFDKQAEQRNFVEKMFTEVMSYAFQEKAQLRTRQAEDIWQAIVKETKANLVVKSWASMSNNLRSNWSQLFLMGVSPLDIVKGHRVAFKGAWEYKQDSAKLFNLQNQIKINHLEPGQTKENMEYQIKRLQDSLARNPVRPLIDAGLMPTIVEDTSIDEDIYSYKSRFDEKIDSLIDGINPHILKTTQLLTMHHSTAPYKIMSYATQVSDFLSRYTLYQHSISKKDPLTHEQAILQASEAFINYDIPTHRAIQYANDSGLIMFSKYYVRIQKIIAKIYKTSPARVLGLLAAEHMLGDQPTVLDSGFTHKFGNPFSLGALDYVGSLDSISTVGLLTSPFTTATWNGQ